MPNKNENVKMDIHIIFLAWQDKDLLILTFENDFWFERFLYLKTKLIAMKIQSEIINHQKYLLNGAINDFLFANFFYNLFRENATSQNEQKFFLKKLWINLAKSMIIFFWELFFFSCFFYHLSKSVLESLVRTTKQYVNLKLWLRKYWI